MVGFVYVYYIFAARMIAIREKGAIDNYMVTCLQSCSNMKVKLRVDSGDADLYAREGDLPQINSSDCGDCPLCRARSSTLTDKCDSFDTPGSSTFYVAVVAHKDYINCEITFSGNNLANVTKHSRQTQHHRPLIIRYRPNAPK